MRIEGRGRGFGFGFVFVFVSLLSFGDCLVWWLFFFSSADTVHILKSDFGLIFLELNDTF